VGTGPLFASSSCSRSIFAMPSPHNPCKSDVGSHVGPVQGEEGGLGEGEGRQDERKTEERRRKGEEERTAMRKQISLTKRRRTRSLYTTQTLQIDHTLSE